MNIWTSFKHALYNLGCSDREIFTMGSLVVVIFSFYLQGWFFVLADWYGFLSKYSIRSGTHQLATEKKQWDAIKEASIDVFIVKPMVFYFIYPYIADTIIQFGDELPSFSTVIFHWLCLKVVFSTSLYFIHRAMHHRSVYQYVHKRHHTYYDTVGFAAQYAHPIEGITSSLHVIFGMLLVRPHFIVYCIFLATTMTEIIDSHCGYDVPWAWLYPWSDRYFWGSGARVHDYHHSHNLGTYGGGLIGIWDKLLGTDSDYLKFEEKRLLHAKKKL